MSVLEEKRIHQIFQISVLLKGAHALLEIIGGIGLFFISTSAIAQFVVALTGGELLEDSHDFLANYFLHMAQAFSIGDKTFAAFYLLSHGVIKIFLVAGLLRDKLWAYPASLTVLSLFIAYQLYRYTFSHSFALILLSIFDLLVIWLIWHEYRLIRLHLPRE